MTSERFELLYNITRNNKLRMEDFCIMLDQCRDDQSNQYFNPPGTIGKGAIAIKESNDKIHLIEKLNAVSKEKMSLEMRIVNIKLEELFEHIKSLD